METTPGRQGPWEVPVPYGLTSNAGFFHLSGLLESVCTDAMSPLVVLIVGHHPHAVAKRVYDGFVELDRKYVHKLNDRPIGIC